jgi:hypothetical protein
MANETGVSDDRSQLKVLIRELKGKSDEFK